jgi:hypothetical protein
MATSAVEADPSGDTLLILLIKQGPAIVPSTNASTEPSLAESTEQPGEK